MISLGTFGQTMVNMFNKKKKPHNISYSTLLRKVQQYGLSKRKQGIQHQKDDGRKGEEKIVAHDQLEGTDLVGILFN